MPAMTQLSNVPWWSALMAGWGGPLVLFAAATTAFFLAARLWQRKPRRQDVRLEQIRPQSPLEAERGNQTASPWTHALAAQIPESEKERRDFELLLRQAGVYAPGASERIYALRFVLLAAPLVAAGICAILANARYTWLILAAGVAAAAFLGVMPRLWVFFRRRRRVQRIREGLPDILDMLGMCVGGGLELGESLDQVARRATAYPECAQELLLLKRHAELGNLKRALEDFARRVDLPETDQLAGLLLRGSHLGTELVGSLNAQAEHLRTARRQAAATRANKTPVKLIFPIMFCFAPAALILLTAPAVVQLRDFLTGRTSADLLKRDMTATRTASSTQVNFGPETIINSIQDLEQSQPNTLPSNPPGPAVVEPQ